MKITKTVKSFLARTGTADSFYCFFILKDKAVKKVSCSSDKTTTLSDYDFKQMPAVDVAVEYVRLGGRLNKIDEFELGKKFPILKGWNFCSFNISDNEKD